MIISKFCDEEDDGFIKVGKFGKHIKHNTNSIEYDILKSNRKELEKDINVMDSALYELEEHILFSKAEKGKCANPQCNEYPLYLGFKLNALKKKNYTIKDLNLIEMNNKGWFLSHFCSASCSRKMINNKSCTFCTYKCCDNFSNYCSDICMKLGQFCRQCGDNINLPDKHGKVKCHPFCSKCSELHVSFKDEQKKLNEVRKQTKLKINNINLQLRELNMSPNHNLVQSKIIKDKNQDNYDNLESDETDNDKHHSKVDVVKEADSSNNFELQPVLSHSPSFDDMLNNDVEHKHEENETLSHSSILDDMLKNDDEENESDINKSFPENAESGILKIMGKLDPNSRTYLILLKELERILIS